MKFILLPRIIFILFIIHSYTSNEEGENFDFSNSYYYEEKYFRILSNNYDSIDPGNFWKLIKASDENNNLGIGFEAKKDFGSLILLKDWSMYNFKLTKIIFRKTCSIKYDKCDAELLLYHTKDNGYYPPGRRIFIRQNFFVIVVPFLKANNDENPSNDLLFKFLNLEGYSKKNNNVTPIKPVKLYHIIQNQPSYLFEGLFDKKETLFMFFTQYHFISKTDYEALEKAIGQNQLENDIIKKYGEGEVYDKKIYRNLKNLEKLNPKVSLMVYSKANYLDNILLLFIMFLI